jgi:citrate lyase subunit beta / citryl-CoA lyase
MSLDESRKLELTEAVANAEARLVELQAGLQSRRTILPLRYWRQTAHFTTPAADEALARKAVESGTGPMRRILERWSIEPEELAERLEVDVQLVVELLERPRRAPLVMLDGEDAQALREDVTDRGLRTAAEVLAGADWRGDGQPTLRFFRPPGFELGTTARDLYTLLWNLAQRSPAGTVPLDGIVFPKVDHPEEVDLLYALLDEAERELGIPSGDIRVAFLVESGWSAVQLPEIAQRASSRLCALIFGLADYSADLRLPAIRNEHMVADWARAMIVNVAGAVDVPAIDGMTLDYPVADAALDEAANRRRILDRLALVYTDALRSRSLGMSGKWVGHPAQLFAVLLAYEETFRSAVVEEEVAKLEAYRSSVEQEARGAMIIGGVMSDRATDRHARALLRKAVALGRFDAQRALALGIIDQAEAEELKETVRA